MIINLEMLCTGIIKISIHIIITHKKMLVAAAAADVAVALDAVSAAAAVGDALAALVAGAGGSFNFVT